MLPIPCWLEAMTDDRSGFRRAVEDSLSIRLGSAKSDWTNDKRHGIPGLDVRLLADAKPRVRQMDLWNCANYDEG